MQNIYEKIDTMFSGQNDDRPQWAVDILDELSEIKDLLQDAKKEKYNIATKQSFDYSSTVGHHRLTQYEFVQGIRKKYNNAVTDDDIIWKNQRLGISEGGLIYNKTTDRIYSTQDAKIIYNELYNLSLDYVQCGVA